MTMLVLLGDDEVLFSASAAVDESALLAVVAAPWLSGMISQLCGVGVALVD